MQRNIFCLESLWSKDPENKQSVLPLLELAERTCSLKFSHLTCNTKAELEYNLKLRPNRKSYGLLYLAFHGSSGSLDLHSKESFGFDDLSNMMGSRYEGWVVHLGSCSTLKDSRDEIVQFMSETGVKAVTGYAKDVDWIESAALDLIVFKKWQDYRNPGNFVKHIVNNFGDLVKINGFDYVL
jgi:hypothetical protein